MANYVFGVDIGGTTVKIGLFTTQGEMVEKWEITTRTDEGGKYILSDIAASVDQFNEWFMRFAPEAFRSTRVETTKHVKAALLATKDLRDLNAAMLKANPGVLPTLRMLFTSKNRSSMVLPRSSYL